MAEQKKIQLELVVPAHWAEYFRTLVADLSDRHTQPENRTFDLAPLGIEILYEEESASSLGNPQVEFSLWFDKPASAYWFALFLAEAKEEWRCIGLDKRIDAALEKLEQDGAVPDG